MMARSKEQQHAGKACQYACKSSAARNRPHVRCLTDGTLASTVNVCARDSKAGDGSRSCRTDQTDDVNSGSSTKLNSCPSRRRFSGDYEKSGAKHETGASLSTIIPVILLIRGGRSRHRHCSCWQKAVVAFHCLQGSTASHSLTHTHTLLFHTLIHNCYQLTVKLNQTISNQPIKRACERLCTEK
jgi:hypothetical protein